MPGAKVAATLPSPSSRERPGARRVEQQRIEAAPIDKETFRRARMTSDRAD
jgi:hypothetical protein